MTSLTNPISNRNLKVLLLATILAAIIFYVNNRYYYNDNIITDEKSHSPIATANSTLSVGYTNATVAILHTTTNNPTSRVTEGVSNLNDKITTNTIVTVAAVQNSVVTAAPVQNTVVTVAGVQKLITSYTPGLLGNKMGVHAASLGLAQINGYKPVMDKEMVMELGKYFDLSTPEMDESSRNLSWNVISVIDYMIDEYRHWNFTYVKLYGYVNSPTFFDHLRPTLRKEFTFKKALQDEAQRILHDISKKIQRKATFVGIHVRRGEYVKEMPEKWKGVIGDKKYLDEATGIFRKRYNDTVFVVVSQDNKWCQENINSSLGDVFYGGNSNISSPGQDMATLAACNHTIMTFGTYAFWAAYLCGGDVVYLANYTLLDSPLLNIIRRNSSHPPEWHGIAADLSPLLSSTTSLATTSLASTPKATS